LDVQHKSRELTMVDVTEIEVAWLAGLLEGEGSFSKGPPSKPNLPRIQLSSTDEDVVSRVARLFDIRYCCARARKHINLIPTKPIFQLQVRGSKAVIWMKRVEPHMGVRRKEQIRVALASHTSKVVRYNKQEFEVMVVTEAQGTGI
jgi:hypothetical protein